MDGIGFSVRDGEHRCVLVAMRVDDLGNKELIVLANGFHESTESWLSLLRDLESRQINTLALMAFKLMQSVQKN